VKLIEDGLDEWLMEYPVIITHDILFQTWFVTHNQAIRNIGKNHPEIKWIHWLHSGPSPRPSKLEYPHTLRFEGMPNSIFVSPNDTMRRKFAEMYNVPLKTIKTVNHTISQERHFEMQPISIEMIEKHGLVDCDGLVVWPTRIDHPEGKGMFTAIHLVGQMNKFANIKFLFLNSWSSDPRAKRNIKRMRAEAEKWGLPQEHLIFSSEWGPEYENGVESEVVRDMLTVGDMFVFPSRTETFSLGMLEAAIHKNMLILNEDLVVMKELAGDRADYMPAGAEWGRECPTR